MGDRPKSFREGPVSMRCIRGPDEGLWYWRATLHIAGERSHLWAGWATPAAARTQAATLRAERYDQGNGWVYLIQADIVNHIKIGHTTWNPYDRLRELQTGSPVRLTVVGAIPGARSLENILHDRFDSWRVHGEWFRTNGALRRLIREWPASVHLRHEHAHRILAQSAQ